MLECHSPLSPYQSWSYYSWHQSKLHLIQIMSLLLHFPCRKLRKRDIGKFHIQRGISLLLMLIMSVILISLSVTEFSTDSIYGLCLLVSILVHYFTLVAVLWMGAEAVLIFTKVIIFFVTISSKFIWTVSIICWGKLLILPFIIIDNNMLLH